MTPQTDDVPSLDLAIDPDTGVALYIPRGWSQIELPGFQLALAMDEPAHAAVDGSLFRPNINVLVSTATPGADAALAATETVAGLMTMDDGRVLAYDLWAGPDGVMGRHVVSAHRDGAITLGVTHWLFVHNGLVTTITATLPITTLPAGEAFGETAVTGLRLPTSGQAPTTPTPTVTVPRPRPDARLASSGEPYEDISAIGPACTYLGTGPQLDRPLVEMIATSIVNAHFRTPRLPRAGRHHPELATLVTAELATDDGHLTDTGIQIGRTLTKPTGLLRVESARGRTPLTLDASIRDGQAVVVATASPADLPSEPRGDAITDTATRVRLDWVDVSYLPLLIASWIGLSPAWSLTIHPEVIPQKLIVQRVDDPALPPPSDADDSLRFVWEQPWFLWTMRAARLKYGRMAVHAGRSGQFMLMQGPDEDHCQFTVTPAAKAWADLTDFVWKAVTGETEESPDEP